MREEKVSECDGALLKTDILSGIWLLFTIYFFIVLFLLFAVFFSVLFGKIYNHECRHTTILQNLHNMKTLFSEKADIKAMSITWAS